MAKGHRGMEKGCGQKETASTEHMSEHRVCSSPSVSSIYIVRMPCIIILIEHELA